MEIKQIEDLASALRVLPGVGEKTARRYAFDLIESNPEALDKLKQAIVEVKSLGRCPICNGYTQADTCQICSDTSRARNCVVVTCYPKEILKIEGIMPNTYRFFALGGVIDPLNGINSKDIYIDELREYVTKYKVKELILILPVTNEGEITASFIKRSLSDLDLNFSKLAQGVPIGASLEYLDEITLLKSIQSASPY